MGTLGSAQYESLERLLGQELCSQSQDFTSLPIHFILACWPGVRAPAYPDGSKLALLSPGLTASVKMAELLPVLCTTRKLWDSVLELGLGSANPGSNSGSICLCVCVTLQRRLISQAFSFSSGKSYDSTYFRGLV